MGFCHSPQSAWGQVADSSKIISEWGSLGPRDVESTAAFYTSDVACSFVQVPTQIELFHAVLQVRANSIPGCGICVLQYAKKPANLASLLASSDSSLFFVTCGISRVASAHVIPKNFTF